MTTAAPWSNCHQNLAFPNKLMIAPFLLREAFPELTAELHELFIWEGKPELADQVSSLEIVDRCRCGDDFCATMYAVRKPKGRWGAGHYNVPLDPEKGMIIVDILDGKIAEVEILFRDEIRERLMKIM